MNPVYIRMFFYVVAPMVAMLPFATYDPVEFTLLIDLDEASVGLVSAVLGIIAVFREWGKK